MIPPVPLTDEVLRLMLANMRNPEQRAADLRAQLVEPRDRGASGWVSWRSGSGRRGLLRGMDELHGYAERRMRAAIRRVPDGRYRASDVVEELEGEAEIRATVTVRGDGVQVDFEGTAEQRPGNLNCPLSVTRSAVYYVVRVVCAPDLEASGGAFVPVAGARPRRAAW